MADILQVDITDNATPALQKLARDLPGTLTTEMQEAMRRALLLLRSRVPEYPPERPGQSYVRTGRLGRSLTSEAGGDSVSEVGGAGMEVWGRWGTNVYYGKWVIGRETQAWMHAGRWWTLEGVADQHLEDVQRLIQGMVEQMVARLVGSIG